MPETVAVDVTRLLSAYAEGDLDAGDQLFEHIYVLMRRFARSKLQSERRDISLEATELVHEAFLAMHGKELRCNDRKHLLNTICGIMSRLLVDRARAKYAKKRGGPHRRQTGLTGHEVVAQGPSELCSSLHDALQVLAEDYPNEALAIQLHYFFGYQVSEVAMALDVSKSTAEKRLRFAKAWLRVQLRGFDFEPGRGRSGRLEP